MGTLPYAAPMTAQEIIERLGLVPHPEEGGFFRETYRAAEGVSAGALPERYGGDRTFGTAIYYLLTPTTISALHKLESDEIFHFYLGGPVQMLQLLPDGTATTITIGNDLAAGQVPQVSVPRGVWQGARLLAGEFALMGCTVCPGFEFADYEHGDRAVLSKQYPDHGAEIERLTMD